MMTGRRVLVGMSGDTAAAVERFRVGANIGSTDAAMRRLIGDALDARDLLAEAQAAARVWAEARSDR